MHSPEICEISKGKLWVYKISGLLFLAIFFYITYNFANNVTLIRAEKSVIPHIMFDWEKQIPLIPWTIIPYWSENLLYGLALLLVANFRQLKTIVMRLFSVQVICVLGFLLFPLQQINIAERPEVSGFFGFWFDELMKFDLPYNQAPSLHIALLVILWQFYHKIIPRRWHLVMHIWALLIALSVLTTWQHHFIDIPAGLLAGCLAIWLFPDKRQSPLRNVFQKAPLRWKWAMLYLSISGLFLIVALLLKGPYLWLLYIVFSFLLVSLNYAVLGKDGFPKEIKGDYQLTNWILFWPYILVAKINARIWTRNNHAYDQVLKQLYLGGMPRKQMVLNTFTSVVDCCAEIPFSLKTPHYYPNFCLDMTPLSMDECRYSADQIHQSLLQGKTLVFCALGYSRSVTATIAYLIQYEGYALKSALKLVENARQGIVLSDQQQQILIAFERDYQSELL